MNIWDVLILAGVAGIVTAGYRSLRATRKRAGGCSGNCSGCSSGTCPGAKRVNGDGSH